jgi:hypothetical protein
MPPGNVTGRRHVSSCADCDETGSPGGLPVVPSVQREKRCDGYRRRTFLLSGAVMIEETVATGTIRMAEDRLRRKVFANAGIVELTAPAKEDR